MFFLIIGGIGFLAFISVIFRTVLFHPIKTIYYGSRDIFFYFKHKEKNRLKTGELICYCALFGRGKTLSVVHYVTQRYYQYNNKMVWCRDRKKFVQQKVHVLSNVDLSIPYEKLTSLTQIVACAERNREKDYENDTLTCTLVLGDEFSVQMNSRSFKTNIDPLFLNTLLTCRHHHITIVYDAQRFGHVDALLRQVTSYVIECNKVWRIMVQNKYDAWDLENANSPKMVQPVKRFGWFVQDKDFNAYDTLACVDNLKKSCSEGDMLSEEEILTLQCNQSGNMDIVSSPSKKYFKNRKKAR